MYNILTLNKIASVGTDLFDKDLYHIGSELPSPSAVLVRSASMHDYDYAAHPGRLKAIARAGAGVNNIPVDKCSEFGIVVFNTPGANANAVKELVIAGLLLSSRHIPDAIDWVKTLKGSGADVGKLVEKGKGEFAGPEIAGKKLGVIGLGAIGALVANAAVHLGMEVLGVDPFLSVDAAVSLSNRVKYVKSFKEVFEQADYITLHTPLTKDTAGLINKETIASMKKTARILNFARGELVDETAVLSALANGNIASYVTDFPTDAMLGVPGIIAIPHLGASSPESEDNCAVMAAKQLIDFLENGNIKNSVNLPNLSMQSVGDAKICVIHKNIEGVLGAVTKIISDAKTNIENMESHSKKDYAYTVLDVTRYEHGLAAKIREAAHVVSVRVINND